jgi:hypothetical protein
MNGILLQFPFLYRLRLVYYETDLSANNGIAELLTHLQMTTEIDGNIIECGCSLCGSSIIMARYLHSKGLHKSIYACDSFSGFDLDELARERNDGLTKASDNAFTLTSYEYVQKKIARLGVDDVVIPIRGFFRDTLPQIQSKFSFALIDCDLKESTLYCAETIWPKLVPHGRILFDDYDSEEFQGVRLGVDTFIKQHSQEIAEHGLLKRFYFVHKKAAPW